MSPSGLPGCGGPACSPMALCVSSASRTADPPSCPQPEQWCPFQHRCLPLASPCQPSPCLNCSNGHQLPPGARMPRYTLQYEVLFSLSAGPAAHVQVRGWTSTSRSLPLGFRSLQLVYEPQSLSVICVCVALHDCTISTSSSYKISWKTSWCPVAMSSACSTMLAPPPSSTASPLHTPCSNRFLLSTCPRCGSATFRSRQTTQPAMTATLFPALRLMCRPRWRMAEEAGWRMWCALSECSTWAKVRPGCRELSCRPGCLSLDSTACW